MASSPLPRVRRPRIGRLLGGWHEDPLWATVYDWTVEHPRAGAPLWRLGIGSDLHRLYAAADEVGRLPAGSAVLDVPCGGGVALRGLRPGQGVRYVAADIATTMLERTARAARARGVDDQVATCAADAGSLPFPDGAFALVVSFTGLHCFPDPRRATAEMVRVVAPGGALTGSALFNDSGVRHEPLRRLGRRANVLGPGCTTSELRTWLAGAGLVEVSVELSGAIGYFRAVRPR